MYPPPFLLAFVVIGESVILRHTKCGRVLKHIELASLLSDRL